MEDVGDPMATPSVRLPKCLNVDVRRSSKPPNNSKTLRFSREVPNINNKFK